MTNVDQLEIEIIQPWSDILMKVKLPFEPSTLAQEAALAALDDDEFMMKSINLNAEQKELMYNFLDCPIDFCNKN